MRLLLAVFSSLLLLIALAGIGIGIAVVGAASGGVGSGGARVGLLAAVEFSTIPFLIGTIALGCLAIVFAVESSKDQQIAAILASRLTAHEHGREVAYTSDPAVIARRARLAAAGASPPDGAD